MERNVYLEMKTLQEARQLLAAAFAVNPLPGETVAVPESVGRVLAAPATAKLSSPGFHAAAMDGIAVLAGTTYGTSEGNPKDLSVGSQAFYVNTGHVMPPDTDAVIMIENIQVLNDRQVRIEAPAFPWQHVRKMGEDIVATELLFPQNHVITPYCIGALLAGGLFEVLVRKRPRILIIPTGSELVDWQVSKPDRLQPGQVLESNSYVLAEMVKSCGGLPVRHPMVMDDVDEIEAAVRQAVSENNFDLVLTVGGSSAGSKDYAGAVISRIGEILVHGVTIMPGKPVIAGKVNECPVFGIPGYPVSAIVAFEQFVQPILCRLLGKPEPQRERLMVAPARKIPSRLGVEEFLRVKLGRVGDGVVATPLPRGAGSITSITEAHGFLRIPRDAEGLSENTPVEAELLRSRSEIENTIVIVGSHDNTLDVISDLIRTRHSTISVSSSHVGSMGGLMAVKRGNCHVAGTHLLDTTDGSYNISYIRRILKDLPVRVVHLVERAQGLIVGKGNPKSIRGLEDLHREDISMVNRQGGSGTRILLDYRLQQLGIAPEAIKGYTDEEFTHMSVAAAVLSRRADVGMGILSAARALDLDFIPVVTEQYDLVIPLQHYDTEKIRRLLETIGMPAFQERVEALGGYNTRRTGEIIL